MASLINQKGSFYGQFYDANRKPQRKQVPLKTKRKRVAERLLRRLEDEFALGEFDPWGSSKSLPYQKLQEAVTGYLESREHLSPHTVEKYRTVLSLLVRHLGGDYPLAQINSGDVQSCLEAKERKAVTKKVYATTMGPFFNWLIAGGVIKLNPTAGVKLARVPSKFPRFMSPEEVARVLSAIRRHEAENLHVESGTCLWLAPVIEANVHLGLRASEICNLRWSDVDLDRETLAVRNREGFRTKSGKDRMLPLSAPPLGVLKKLNGKRLDSTEDDYVFKVSSEAGQLSRHYLSRRFKRFARLAELPETVNLHTTRHTCASWLAQSGCGVEAIRLYLGHSSVRVTERYMHLSPDGLASQIRAAFG